MINKTQLLDFDDLIIQPTTTSKIRSRAECNPFADENMLPLFTAPMDTVVSAENYQQFTEKGIYAILPRGEQLCRYSALSSCFFSYGLEEFKELFLGDNGPSADLKLYALIDIANGHMEDLLNTVMAAKAKYGSQLVLMVGNVANPITYQVLAKAGADYVRVGIGNGGGCLTTEQTGVGYPMASLVDHCWQYKQGLPPNMRAKIVADGGMKKYADIIKALALGADYVMCGSIFNKAFESAAETMYKLEGGSRTWEEHVKSWSFEADPKSRGFFSEDIIDSETNVNRAIKEGKLFKAYRGMSTKAVQEAWGKAPKTSEGIEKTQRVEYTLAGWVDNFTSYLKSAMSYTGATTLDDFRGKTVLNTISENAFKRYNK